MDIYSCNVIVRQYYPSNRICKIVFLVLVEIRVVGISCELLIELTVSGDSPQCSAAVTMRIRAIGAKAGFFDAEKLITMTENAAAAILFSSDIIVKKLVCGELQKNMPTGRLEQTVELTALTTIETEEDE